MKRVVIVGSPGTGKTTFARQLADKTGLPLIHLDFYYHDKNHDYYNDKTAWNRRVLELIKQDEWIIDGNYSSTIPQRFERADTIIFLDYPTKVAFYRVLKRRIKYNKKQRPEMPSYWKEKTDRAFLKYVLRFNKSKRPTILDEIKKHANKRVIIFKNTSELKKFLQNL